MNIKSTIDLLRSHALKSVRVTNSDYPHILDPSLNDFLHPTGLHKGLLKAFSFISANPNDSQKKRLMQLFYVSKRERLSTENTGNDVAIADRQIPNPDALHNLESTLLASGVTDVLILGGRGSGKSTAVNYIFNCRFHKFTENRATIFRADIAKLHEKINVPRTERGETPLSLTRYMIFHAILVMLEHSKNNAEIALKAFNEDAYKSYEIAANSTFVRYLGLENEVLDLWKKTVLAFRNRNSSKIKDADLIDFINQINNCCSSDQILLKLWLEITSFLKDTRHGNLSRIILIFDGVDNLHSDEFLAQKSSKKTNKQWYEDYLAEINQYYLRQPQVAQADQYVYSFRNETYSDLKKKGLALGHANENIEKFHCVSKRPSRLVLQRLVNLDQINVRTLFASDNGGTDGSRSAPAIEASIKELKSAFRGHVRKLIKQQHKVLMEYLKSCGAATSEKYDTATASMYIVQYLFNNNIRSFFRNLVFSFTAIDLYRKKNSDAQVSTDHIFESSVLAGNRFFAQNFNSDVKGRWCPNMFEIYDAQKNGKWPGLCSYRILNLLPNQNDYSDKRALNLSELREALGLIDYENETVEKNANALLEYGLIAERDATPAGARYQKTAKGSFIEWLTFNNAAVLYLMALGSKFPRYRINAGFDDEKIDGKWIHNVHSPRYFWICAARTGAQFLRSINQISTAEYKKIQSYPADSPCPEVLRRLAVIDTKSVEKELADQLEKAKSNSISYENEVNALFREWSDIQT